MAGSVTALLLVLLPKPRAIGRELAELQARLRARSEQMAPLNEQKKRWVAHESSLLSIREAQRQYEGAVEHHRKLAAILNSRRYRLRHCDWRSLRDTPFEDFVAEVFEELGYSVEKTKVTGDQGIDLIVTGRGRRIAVQTKGWKDKVGNGAVQEAYAGMTFYRCNECAVVTNSAFTRGAVALARSVRCLLIDGSDIPRLIEGELY